MSDAATSRITARALPEGAPPPRYGRFALHFDATADTIISLDIRASASFSSMCVAFESVELLECELELSVPANDKGPRITFGFAPAGATSTTLLTHAHTRQFFASHYNGESRTISLPADHNFGRELKATVLGNSVPVAYVVARGKDGVACLRFRACFHGSALG